MNKPVKSVFYLIVAGSAVAQAVYALLFYIKGVYGDQWDLVPLLNEYWLKLVFTHHGDHFHSAAYLIMLPLAQLTNWNLLWELLVIILLNGVSFYLLYKRLLIHIINFDSKLCLALVSIIALLYFSVAHGGNLLWTWQLAVYTAVFGMMVTVDSLAAPELTVPRFCLSLLGGLIASLSFSCGFAVWPVGVFLILFNNTHSLRLRIFLITVWCLIGLAAVFWLLADMGGGFSQQLEINPLRTLIFILYFLGTPLAYFSREVSLLAAAVGLGGFVYLTGWLAIRSKGRDRNLIIVAVSLAIFALVAGLLISLGRLELGFSQARSFRYILFSQFFWFSLLSLIAFYLKQKPVSKLTSKSLSMVIWVVFVLVIFNSQKIGRSSAESAQRYNAFVSIIKEADRNHQDQLLLQLDYPDVETLKLSVAQLRRYQLNIFR